VAETESMKDGFAHRAWPVSNEPDASSDSLMGGSGWSRREVCRAGLGALAVFAVHPLAVGSAQTQIPAPVEPAPAPVEPEPRQLFIPERFPEGWVFVSAEKDVPLSTTWQVSRDEGGNTAFLRCLGKPQGYIRTKDVFDNYDLGLQWRFPDDPNGNSGILLHTSDMDRIWPNCIQLQLHRPKAGSVFPGGEALSDNRLDVKDKSRPLNVWNDCVVSCRDGRIAVTINDEKIGEVTGCVPGKGFISLQSEGSEVHFRRIWLKTMTPQPVPPPATAS